MRPLPQSEIPSRGTIPILRASSSCVRTFHAIGQMPRRPGRKDYAPSQRALPKHPKAKSPYRRLQTCSWVPFGERQLGRKRWGATDTCQRDWGVPDHYSKGIGSASVRPRRNAILSAFPGDRQLEKPQVRRGTGPMLPAERVIPRRVKAPYPHPNLRRLRLQASGVRLQLPTTQVSGLRFPRPPCPPSELIPLCVT